MIPYFFLEDLNLADLTLEVGKNIGDDLLITYSTPLIPRRSKSYSDYNFHRVYL